MANSPGTAMEKIAAQELPLAQGHSGILAWLRTWRQVLIAELLQLLEGRKDDA